MDSDEKMVESSFLSAEGLKKQKPLSIQMKQVHIPKLALQKIQRQPSEQSHNSQAQLHQISAV